MADRSRLSRLVWGALMPGVRTPGVEAWVHAALAAGVESVCLFGDAVGSPARVGSTVRALRRSASDLLVATDEEGGEVTRIEAVAGSRFLSARALGVVDDLDVTGAQARLMGRLLRRVGVDWTLAPVADVNVDPRNPVIGVRSYGPDAVRAGEHVAATVTGLQTAGVVATPKHFPGHGDTHVDSHEDLPVLSVEQAALDGRELVPFRAAIASGCASVMTGHLLVRVLDAHAPASLSRPITTGLLRGQLGFDGVVVTDAVEMGAVAGVDRERLAAATVAALAAGADVVCLGAADQERALADSAAAVLAAVRDGVLDVTLLESAAERRRALRQVGSDSASTQVAADAGLLAEAASRSLTVDGDVRVDRGVDVLTVAARPGYAAGPTGWRLAPRLRSLGVDVRAVTEPSPGRRLVIEVRDAWKDDRLRAMLDDALARRPDAVVVDVGWPTDLGSSAAGQVRTYGTGALSATLAACLLAGVEPVAVVRPLIAESL